MPLKKHQKSQKLRKEISNRRYKKYQDRRLGADGGDATDEGEAAGESANEQDDIPKQNGTDQNGLVNLEPVGEEQPRGRRKKKQAKEPESAIDVLYENQRGLFLCGAALFSSKALGNLDPSPWTNIAHKTSATNPTNAQVPDPTWEWAWKEWSINRENDVDEDGWEYSFAFAKAFSWHGRSWWKSFVRRRAWIRKRVRKNAGYLAQQPDNILTADYFTINSTVRDRSQSRPSTLADAKRMSVAQRTSLNIEDHEVDEEICDINALMSALKTARIDREKLEAVENFIQNGGGDLYYLKDRMHDIMKMFIFQASRKILLAHLHEQYDEAEKSQQNVPVKSEKGKDEEEEENNDVRSKRKRREHLSAALEHADEEVKKLEFWSDVKEMAESGDTKHAVDARKGWEGKEWEGIDNSGPKDVISMPEDAEVKDDKEGVEGRDGGGKKEGNGNVVSVEEVKEEGKGKDA